MLRAGIAAAFCVAAVAFGCEADGRIWMPMTDLADPLFRFVRNGKAGFIDPTGKVVIEPTLSVGSNWGQFFYGGMLGLGTTAGPLLDTNGRRHEFRGVEVRLEYVDGEVLRPRREV